MTFCHRSWRWLVVAEMIYDFLRLCLHGGFPKSWPVALCPPGQPHSRNARWVVHFERAIGILKSQPRLTESGGAEIIQTLTMAKEACHKAFPLSSKRLKQPRK